MPAVFGQGVGEPCVDVGLGVPAGSPRELVADGFVPVAGLGLLQGAEVSQRLEFVGAGRDAGGFALVGLPGGGEQLGTADVVRQLLVLGSLPHMEPGTLESLTDLHAANPGTPGGRSDG